MMYKIILICLFINIIFNITALDATQDQVSSVTTTGTTVATTINNTTQDNSDDQEDMRQSILEVLQFGIDSEITGLLSDIGTNPDPEILQTIIARYKAAKLTATKVDFIKYFMTIKNPPSFLTDTLFEDTSADYLDKQIQVALINCFAKIGGARGGRYMIDFLDDEDRLLSYSAAQGLSELTTDELVPEILARLQENDEDYDNQLSADIKSKLILGLGEMGSPESIPYLREVAGDVISDKFQIAYAMVSLAKLKDYESIPLLEGNLGHTEVKVQEYAAYALSMIELPAVVPVLNRMLLHNNEQVRIYACQGLSLNLNASSSIPALSYKFRKDPSAKVKNEALFSLLKIGSTGVDELKDIFTKIKMTPTYLSSISEAVAKYPNEANTAYILELYNKALTDKDKKSIEAVSKKIIYCSSNLVDPIISLLLTSDDYLIRMGGIKATSYIENTTLLDKLDDISKNDTVKVVKDYAKKVLALKNIK